MMAFSVCSRLFFQRGLPKAMQFWRFFTCSYILADEVRLREGNVELCFVGIFYEKIFFFNRLGSWLFSQRLKIFLCHG